MSVLRDLLPLESNGFALVNRPEQRGRLVPTDPATPLHELREHYLQQGYLWLKGILQRAEVLEFRRRYFTAFRDAGLPLLAAGTDPVDGIYDSFAPQVDPGLYHKITAEIVRWAEYEAFCLATPIRRFYERFLEGAPYLHKRKLIRYGKPHDPHTTGAHYDLIYLRGGTDRICTSWIPIGDTPVECGGLVYLEGSDAWGRQKEAEFTALSHDLAPDERISAYNKNMKTGWLSKNLAQMAEELELRWLVADYEAGDMVVHSPYMVHASTMNIDPLQRMRLSTDIRYQRVRDEIDVRWNNHWSLDDML